MNYIGSNIKKIREYWDLSQEDFGAIIGATRGMIMQYEKRGSIPKDETIENLILLTGLSKETLMETDLKRKDYPDKNSIENYAIIRGSGNTAIAGNGNHINSLTEKFLDLLKKKDEQMDRLLGIIEAQCQEGKMSKQ